MAAKAVVAIGVEAYTAFGREIMRGVMQYANIRREWLLAEEFNISTTDPQDWPACDGAVVAASEPAKLAMFQEHCPYLVSCSGAADAALVPVVSLDDVAVGRVAAEHLLECRLQHFGFFGAESDGIGLNRARGFTDLLAERGHTCSICPVEFSWERQLRRTRMKHWPALAKWVQSLPKPAGILTRDDMAAHALAAVCQQAGVPVPDQVAIVGVNDDDLLCESAWPPLSSVRCDYQRVGFGCAKLLDALMQGKEVTQRCTRLPPVGIARRLSTDLLAVGDPDLAAAMRFIREHACDPCSVSDVLRHVPVGRRWLERNFLEQIGRTPYEEITSVRVRRAEELLLKTRLTMLEVAGACGFSDTRNFTHQFHKVTGETPAAFRRARRNR